MYMIVVHSQQIGIFKLQTSFSSAGDKKPE